MNKQGWELKKLGDIATYINGYAFKPIDWEDQGLPIIRIQNLNSPTASYNYTTKQLDKKYIVYNGDILISWSASLGVYEWLGKKAILNQHIFKVVFNKIKINKIFFKYQIHKKIIEMLQHIHGATMKHITKKNFDNIVFLLPAISIQNQIVKELDTLQAIISKKKAQLVELDSLAQATFYEMFGEQFLKDYQIKSLGNLFLFIDYRGSTPNKIKTGIPLITAKNIKKGYIDFSSKDFISEDDYLKRQKRGIGKKGDILFTTEAPLGNIAIANIDRYSSGQRVIIFQANSQNKKNINNIFYMHYILSNFFQDSLDQLKTGATAKGIKASKLKNINMPVPPIGLQNQFAKRIEAIEKQKALINQSISETQLLFDSAMDNYFN